MRPEVIREVEQFLYREARLLDERRFHTWLELFTDDVRSRTSTLRINITGSLVECHGGKKL
jgi:3-phenylpropionate/cinnamic acid dioxygenase small subunit